MMKMLVCLRNTEEYDSDIDFQFALPLHRVWFESVTGDLNLQFLGHEDINVRPHENSLDGEMIVSQHSFVFRAWLAKLGLPSVGTLRIQTCFIESVNPNADELPEPPPDVLADLVLHWNSPNLPLVSYASSK